MRNSTTTLNAEADAWAALCTNGTIEFYDGTQPADPQTAITTQNLLCAIDFGASPFSSATGGILALVSSLSGTITDGGTTTWARGFKTDGTTVIFDGTVGIESSGADFELETTTLVLDDLLQLESVSYTRPAA